jgi:hypothetical protein
MDNEQLLNEIQKLLEGVEKRTNIRFDTVGAETEQLRRDLTARIDRLDNRLEMLAGIIAILAPVVIRLDSRVQKLEDAK